MNTSTTSLLPHHRLRVYWVAIEFLRAVRAAKITDREMRDQAISAAKSACRNIAEAAGRVSRADKTRVFGIARGEAVEAIATAEIAIEAGDGAPEALANVLDRGNALYAMLSGLCRAR
ncbi:MAG TPA: four helix bundle protein [Polyangiaceae bacterium]|nr:four helix bundle protein [Polyangiaceae bacterium]